MELKEKINKDWEEKQKSVSSGDSPNFRFNVNKNKRKTKDTNSLTLELFLLESSVQKEDSKNSFGQTGPFKNSPGSKKSSFH